MQLYNYVAGGPFPPGIPEGFSEWKFGHADIVIFALAGTNDDYHAHGLAMRLQTDREFRGLVYSLSPENRDYQKCANFFRVSTFPSYVVISYRAFRELLCTDSEMSHLGDDREYFGRHWLHDEHQHWPIYQHSRIGYSEGLDYAIINGDILEKSSSTDIEEEVLRLAHCFCIQGMPKAVGIVLLVRRISRSHLDALKYSAQPLYHRTEIILLFTRPAWRHTEFERILYEAFIQFGSVTDDVLVRILYPSYISEEYAKRIAEYDVIRLPAAIFSLGHTGRLVLKVERDFFECIPDLSKRVAFVISDIHRSIAAGHTKIAKKLVNELRASVIDQTVVAEESETASGKVVVQLRPKNAFVIHKMKGDIVVGDKVQKQCSQS